MTCIVAFKTEEGHSVLAGDFMASNGHSFHKITTPKIFLKSDKCAVGYTSSFRMGQILEHYWALPPKIEGIDIDRYICVDVVESIRATFRKYGYGNSEGLEEIGGNFVLLYEDRIYEVQYNYSVLEYEDDIVAVGSGGDAAAASLHCLLPITLDNLDNTLDAVFRATNKVTASVSAEYSYIVLGELGEEEEEESSELLINKPN